MDSVLISSGSLAHTLQSAHADNIVVGIVRNKSGAEDLLKLQRANRSIHVFEADVTDRAALKVRFLWSAAQG